MNVEKVRIVETIRTSVTNKVESLSSDVKVTANVTLQDGEVVSIDMIRAEDASGNILFEGWANPNIGGNFYVSGVESEVISAVTDFIEAVRNEN